MDILLGLLVGFILAFCFASWAHDDLKRDYTKAGVMLVDKRAYSVKPLDLSHD